MDKWIKQMKSQWKAAFSGTFLIGFLTYFYTMSHHFLTYDSMWNLYSAQDMITSGRQFLTYACRISSDYDLPALNGILAIFYLSLTAVVLTEVFCVRNNLTAVLIGGLLVTFPSISSTFCYTYTIDGYMLAVLLTTVGFWLANRYRHGWIAGIFLTGIALGIYQAYFAYLIVLCILVLLLDLLKEDSRKKLIVKAVKFILMGICGYLFYMVTLKIMLTIKGISLSGYQGTDKVLGFSLKEIPKGLSAAFDSFYQFAAWGNVLTTTNVMKYMFVGLTVLGGLAYLICFISRKRYKDLFRLIIGVLLVATIPFGSNIVTIMSPLTTFHLLMRYSWVLFFVFVLAVAEQIEWKRALKLENPVKALVGIFTAVLIFEFSVMANIVAFNMEERYEKTYALCVRLVDRLEQTDGYKTGMKVAILGGFPNQTNYPATSITEEDLHGYFGASGEYCVNSTQKIAEFCAHYLNVTLTTIPFEEEIELTGREEFLEMEKFPDKESIRLIDDVWVIKLNG